MIPLEEIFCFIDDFCKSFDAKFQGRCLFNPHRVRHRSYKMSLSEIMTVLVMFQFSHYRTFKDFYYSCLLPYYHSAFPSLVSYSRLTELMPYAVMPLLILTKSVQADRMGKYFIDSTLLPVCHNRG